MGYLSEGRKGFMGGLSKIFGNNDNAVASPGEAAAKADMYICVNASTIELPDIEKYVAEYVGDKPIVLWNLELDVLRADLGMPSQVHVWHLSLFTLWLHFCDVVMCRSLLMSDHRVVNLIVLRQYKP